MKDHSNLSQEDKESLGFIASFVKQKAGLIFNFEHDKYKDYDKLACDLYHCNQRISELRNKLDHLPAENVRIFNEGIYTGLVNPNRLSYIAYYE